MTFALTRGFNRLWLVLTIVWVLYCAVIYPVQRQWEWQQRAFIEYQDENKNCDQLMIDVPSWSMAHDCYQRSTENLNGKLQTFSLSSFWRWDVVFWKLVIPSMFFPPLGVYAIAAIVRWIWQGFNISSKA